jgi:hypothetical protein
LGVEERGDEDKHSKHMAERDHEVTKCSASKKVRYWEIWTGWSNELRNTE